jgi:hypothetical protein
VRCPAGFNQPPARHNPNQPPYEATGTAQALAKRLKAPSTQLGLKSLLKEFNATIIAN